jgi:hypothetical protein
MPTVNDFINRFGGGGTMDDREAASFLDRFASTNDDDREFDNDALYEGATEHLGKLPDDQFRQSAESAYEHAPPQARSGLVQTLLGALQGRGFDLGSLAPQLGLGSSDPNRMSGSDFARLADYTRRNHPDAIRQTVQQQPWLLKAMGNPVLMGALGMVASHLIRKRTGK